MAKRKKTKRTQSETTTVKIKRATHAKLREVAAERGMMVQGVIDVAVNRWIDAEERDADFLHDVGGAWTDQVQAAD